ncbi:MAG TPA: hypothetical protein VL501_03065 [Pyrinomonadaceae bacterium]|nr:hypothetical protein [Pyrinomonadaceae bacterium]
MGSRAEYKLVIEPREGYLYVVFGGDPLTLEMILSFINGVAAAIKEGNYTRVLLRREAPLLDSDMNRAMVANIIRSRVGDGVRFAIVDGFGNDPAEAEAAAYNARSAGWDLTPFADEEKAEEWLLGL